LPIAAPHLGRPAGEAALLNPRCHLPAARDNRVPEITWGEHDTAHTGEPSIDQEDLDRILKLVLDRIQGEKAQPSQ
jgi:hypothetical protein